MLTRSLIVGSVIWVSLCVLADLPGGLPLDVTFFSLLVWQCSLLGLWAGLGTARWRLTWIAAASPMLGLIASLGTSGALVEFQVFCLGIIVVVTVAAVVLRFLLGPLRKTDASQIAGDAFQFSVQHLLVWTTAVAIILGIFRLGAGFFLDTSGGVSDLNEIFALAASLAAASVVNLWAALSPRLSPLRLTIFLAATALAALAAYRLEGDWLFPSTAIASQLLILITLILIRIQRYRFQGRGRQESSENLAQG